MADKVHVVHYLNQFFGQIGGEDKAGVPPLVREEPVGPGLAFKQAFEDKAEIIATVICGDTFFAENMDEARTKVIEMIARYNPDVVIAGPAFNAGRYGTACGAVAQGVAEILNKPVVTGMHPENPGVELFKRYAYIIETGASAAAMRKAVAPMARLALKLGRGEEAGPPKKKDTSRGESEKMFFVLRGVPKGP